MAYSAWPFSCPNSWQEVPVRPVVRSEIEDGQAKVRRRFTKIWSQYQVKFRLPWSSYAAFWTFFEIDCGAGSIPFTLAHPVTGESLIVRFAATPTSNAGVDIKPYFDVEATIEKMFS